MSKPSDLWLAYAPWRDKLEGKSVPLHADKAEPGFYCRRFVKGGPLVPVAIWIEQNIDANGLLTSPERIVALVNGKLTRADVHWNHCCDKAITHAAYDAAMLTGAVETGRTETTGAAAPAYTKATDPLSVPPIY